MKYKIVLNGCSSTYRIQAGETGAFIRNNLESQPGDGSTIVFYNDGAAKENLIAASPTTRLHLVKINSYRPEAVLTYLKELEYGIECDLYLFPGDYAGSELSTRFAARTGGSSIAAVDKIEPGSESLTCYRAIYSNYLRGRFRLGKKPFCLSIARGLSAGAPGNQIEKRQVTESDFWDLPENRFTRDCEFTAADPVGELGRAPFILAAGRGVKSREKTEMLGKIAKELGAELGVSRPVAMSAWAPLDRLLGISGTMARPKLCLAAAVSGAAAFYAGIEKSKKIVAINIDAQAPLVRAADVAIIDDYETVLKELVKLVQSGEPRE